jgi:transcriptional regulator with XRE-family HTH domain
MVLPRTPPLTRLRVTPDEPANPPAAGPPAVAKRSRRGRGRPYPDETVRRVRHLLETTTLSQMEIARRTGVKQATISVWQRHNRWFRPLGAPLNPAIASLWRIGPAMKLSLLTGRLVAIAERMTRELEENPDTDIDKLMQALQAVRMARVTLQGNRRRKLLIGRARTGFEVMEEDAAICAALKEMRRGGVDIDRAPQEALDLVIDANTPVEKDHPALRERGKGRRR